jgi:hypothetical protein
MRNGFLLILTLGIIAVLLFATFPGQATKAQSAESPTQDNQRVDSRSALDMIEQTAYLAQPTPLLSESANNPTVVQTAITAAECSPIAETDDDTEMDWRQHLPPIHPSYRYGYGMAYDSARGVTVLFGGSAGGG